MVTRPEGRVVSVLAVLAVLGGACVVDSLQSEGRPCLKDTDCGEGTVCDPASQRCVASTGIHDAKTDSPAISDAPQNDDVSGKFDLSTKTDFSIIKDQSGKTESSITKDLPGKTDGLLKKDGPQPDKKPLQDGKSPDKLLKTDGPCPTGTTLCAGSCVNILTNVKHCGACNKACPQERSDTCINGLCGCGTVVGLCSAGLNCKSGSCICMAGGECQGCCQSNTCVSLSSQDIYKCGKNGSACSSCTSSNTCQTPSCSVLGVCGTVTKINGTTCNDQKACTYGDACQSGSCQGTSYTCNDSLSCTTDTCTGNAPPSQCSFAIQSGYCAITVGASKTCFQNGALNPQDPCQKCDSAQSQLVWTTVTGCTSQATVSSVVPYSSLNYPRDVLVGSGGLLIVADAFGHAIKTINGSTIATLAGTGQQGFTDGSAATAQFNEPSQIALDGNGALYIADRSNNAIRKLVSGQVSTVAGIGAQGSADGSVATATFYYPCGVAVDSKGVIYVADTHNYTIRRIASGQVTTIAGSPGSSGYVDGQGTQARFYIPYGLMLDGTSLYVADMYNNRIRQVDLASGAFTVTTVAGDGTQASKDGPAASAQFNLPVDLVKGGSGRIYIAEYGGYLVRILNNGQVTTLAGDGTNGYLDGAALSAKFRYPHGLDTYASGGKGYLYVADYNNHTIRMISLPYLP